MNAWRLRTMIRARFVSIAPSACLLALLAAAPCTQASETSPSVQDLNTTRVFPIVETKQEWTARAAQIRREALASCGLSPMPEKTPLNAKVFDRVERDGYTIEKVYFQSYPGFYVGGNLYRPLNQGAGPFPGVLNPHGHWANGRMADEASGSIAARCIHFARHGMVAFSYDMVGYNDTFFPNHPRMPANEAYKRHRFFGTNQTDELWNISLMGLQTWNSIRALDFIESLPDVDRKRLACTGESGGGTQTFMLGAIDDRLAVQAPIVMVSSVMQGGCSCENAPGLRVRYSNMEIAAAAVPRPQFLVAATGDWTRYTLSLEGPAIEHIYQLFGAADRFDYVRYDFGHNYNQKSREAVYGWFNRWLLKSDSTAPISETPYTKEPDAALRVFPQNRLPSDAISDAELVLNLKEGMKRRWEGSLPRSRGTLAKYREAYAPGWEHVIQRSQPGSLKVAAKPAGTSSTALMAGYEIWDEAEPQHKILLNVTQPSKRKSARVAVLATSAPDRMEREVASLRTGLLNQGWAVVLVQAFGKTAATNHFANFYTTYNRTRAQQGAADLVLVCEYVRQSLGPKVLALCGDAAAGSWALLAAPAADVVVADCQTLDTSRDEALLHPDVFSPGLRALGGLQGAALLAAPNPIYLHNTGKSFATEYLAAAYDGLKAADKLSLNPGLSSSREILSWLIRLK